MLGDAAHRELVDHLQTIADTIVTPSAIVVVSAHWEAPVVTITAAANPGLNYDYYGFPPESYALEYAAPGAPALAVRLAASLSERDVPARLDDERGFDHGLYIPLMIMYPEAKIPCVQVSLCAGLDPALHIRIGEALSWLAGENVLVLGSGFSFHNLRALMSRSAPGPDPDNEAFEAWLAETCSDTSINEAERASRLIGWSSAPGARHSHPREEHLMPLHVCYGTRRTACLHFDELTIMRKKASAYFW